MEIKDFISDGPIGGNFNVNLYYEPDTVYGVPALVSFPGLYDAVTVGAGPIRGMLAYKDILYIASGNDLYVWTGSGSATLKSEDTFNSSSGPVGMVATGSDQIAMTDYTANLIYRWAISDTETGDGAWTEAAITAGMIPAFITYQDTFCLVGDSNSRKIYCSAIDDATSWTATDVSTKMGAPDLIRGGISSGTTLWIFGTETTEPWHYTAAAAGMPFTRMQGGLLDVGCWAANSVALCDGSVFWLNNHGEVCRTVGYGYKVISPPQLTAAIQQQAASSESRVTNAIGMVVNWEGNLFYVLTFPTPPLTYAYSVTAAAAGQKGWFRLSGATSTARYPGNCSAYFKGYWFLGDYDTTGTLWALKSSHYGIDTNTRPVIKYSNYIAEDGKRIIYDEFSLRAVSDNKAAVNASTAMKVAAVATDTTIDVDSITGIGDGDAISIQLDAGSYHLTTVNGAPSGDTVTLTDAMPGAAAISNNVFAYEYYSWNPSLQLTASSGYSCTKYYSFGYSDTLGAAPNPIKWQSLGSGYENLFTLTYTSSDKLTMLGASIKARACKR